MNQETGNNSSSQNRELSIQITLSGFSFCIAQSGVLQYSVECDHFDFGSAPGFSESFDNVYVGWATELVQMVPADIFEQEYLYRYQEAANMLPPRSWVLYNNTVNAGMVAVWSVNYAIYNSIISLFPRAYHYHNLQIDIAKTYRECVRVSVCRSYSNIVVCGLDHLQACQTMRGCTPESMLYYALRLNSSDHFMRHTLEFEAEDCAEYEELFRRSFLQANFVNNTNMYHNTILRCE